MFTSFMFRRWQPDLLLFDPLYKVETLMHRLLPSWLLQPRWCRVYEMPIPKGPPEESDTVAFRWASAADTALLESQFRERLISTRLSYGHRAAIFTVGCGPSRSVASLACGLPPTKPIDFIANRGWL
jgi:hypothetical protein